MSFDFVILVTLVVSDVSIPSGSNEGAGGFNKTVINSY